MNDVSNAINDQFYSLKDIGQKVEFLRKVLKFNQQQDLDFALHFTRNTIHRIESGKGANANNLVRLLKFFHDNNFNLNWLFTEGDDKNFMNTNNNDVIGKISSEDFDVILNILNHAKSNLPETESDNQ
jgi:hypothetical protein